MSQTLTFARPYARAAFSLAREQGRLPAWSQLLAFSAQAASETLARSTTSRFPQRMLLLFMVLRSSRPP